MAGSEAMGCLSELPTDVIHHIFSYLTNKEAIRLSILSKELLSALRTRPTLVFDHESIRSEELDLGAIWDHSRKEKRYEEELNYMLSTLIRCHEEDIGLETFILKADSSFHSVTEDLYDQCIQLATKKVLSLTNLNLSLRRYYVLPAPVCGVESLVQLSLQGCQLQHERIMWHNLKRLCFENVSFEEGMLENLIRGCPLIEILEIYQCCSNFPNFNFKVSKLHNLNQLNARLLFSQTVEINDAPNLESVACKYSLGDIHTTSSSLNLRKSEYQNLKSLLLHDNVRIDDNFFVNLAHKFPCLEDLSFQGYHNLQRINISSPSLKKIQLVNISELQEARFDVPSIVLFEFDNYGGFGSKIIVPKLSFTGASGGWISRVKLECNANVDTSWFIELRELLTALNGSETFISVYFKGEVDFDVARMTDSVSFSGGQMIQEFFIQKSPRQFSLSSALAILDGIFWICRPQTIKLRHYWFNNDFPKLLFDMLISRRHPGHSNFQHIKFWDVTAIQIFQQTLSKDGINFYYSKKGRGLQLPQPSDRRKFLVLLEDHDRSNKLIVGFNLEWKTCDMPREVKRLKSSRY